MNRLFLLILLVLAKGDDYYAIPSDTSASKRTTQATDNKELGTCECDLTANSCDQLCCCDSSCPSAYRASLAKSNPFQCYQFSSYQCYDRTYLIYINPKIGMNIVNQLSNKDRVCIESDQKDTQQYPYLTEYALPSDQARLLAVQTPEQQGYYAPQTGKQRVSDSPALLNMDWILPDSAGHCLFLNNALPLLPDQPPKTCLLSIPLSATTCTSGSSLDVTAMLALTTYPASLLEVFSIASDSSVSTLTSSTPSFSVSGQACTCNNAVRILRFFIVLDGATVTKVTLQAYVTSVTMSTCGTYLFPVEVSYSFVTAGYGSLGQGGPGYSPSSPLHLGVKSTDYIQSSVAPAALDYQKQDNSCLFSVSGEQDPSLAFPLLFSHNTLLSCTMQFSSAAALQSFCTPDSLPKLPVFSTLNSNTYLAKGPTSNVNYLADWVPLEVDSTHDPVSFSSSTCSFPRQMNLQLNYQSVGLVGHPQTVLHSAYLFYSPNEPTVFRQSPLLLPLSLNITYVSLDNIYSPPPVYLLPQLPLDFFLPLQNTAALPSLSLLLLLLISLLLF